MVFAKVSCAAFDEAEMIAMSDCANANEKYEARKVMGAYLTGTMVDRDVVYVLLGWCRKQMAVNRWGK
jgi:hypothetical protein